MNITEATDILNNEYRDGKTPVGRPLTEFAKKSVKTALEDVKNQHMDVVKCLGCGFVNSILLTADGCSNCGVIDMSTEII